MAENASKFPPYWAAEKELGRARLALSIAKRTGRRDYLRHALGAMRNACVLMGYRSAN